MWGEYLNAGLDLTDTGGIVNSRPYTQGTQSLDGSAVFVRFVDGETPWPNGTLYETAGAARTRLQHEDYVMPPTVEEQAAIIRGQIISAAQQKEHSGIAWADSEGNVYGFATDAATQARMTSSQLAIIKGIRTEGGPWPCLDVSTGQSTLRPMANAELGAVVDAAFHQAANAAAAMAIALGKLAGGDLSVDFEAEFNAL